jgi:hypothetical protein
VNVIVVVVVGLGVFQLSRTSRETFPNVTLPRLFVNGVLPGASARDVETKITIPIQEAVEELDGVKEFYTTVADATSATEIRLHENYDTDRVRQAERDLRVLLDGIKDFPPEMEDDPRITRMNPKLFPVVEVALAGPTDSIVDAARVLERKLRALDEASRVTLVGLQDPEVRILVDPVRARAHGVTLLEVVDAVRRRNVSGTGGMLESESDRRQVVLWSRFTDPAEVGGTVLRFLPNGAALTVADVARIESGREDIGLIAHTNAQPGISIVVVKQEDADIIRTVDAVRATMEATPLPLGVTATIVNDESYMARNRLELMFNNGGIGAVLVALILFVFLTPSSAALTLIGIPVVFLATLMLFPLVDYSINMVTLTGLVVVLGMVVDAAIVVAERIVSRRQAGEERKQAAVAGTREMASPVIASAITTMLAFIPLWGLAGMSGDAHGRDPRPDGLRAGLVPDPAGAHEHGRRSQGGAEAAVHGAPRGALPPGARLGAGATRAPGSRLSGGSAADLPRHRPAHAGDAVSAGRLRGALRQAEPAAGHATGAYRGGGRVDRASGGPPDGTRSGRVARACRSPQARAPSGAAGTRLRRERRHRDGHRVPHQPNPHSVGVGRDPAARPRDPRTGRSGDRGRDHGSAHR